MCFEPRRNATARDSKLVLDAARISRTVGNTSRSLGRAIFIDFLFGHTRLFVHTAVIIASTFRFQLAHRCTSNVRQTSVFTDTTIWYSNHILPNCSANDVTVAMHRTGDCFWKNFRQQHCEPHASSGGYKWFVSMVIAHKSKIWFSWP
jgi:hypothetical protein